eukprot:3440651-Pyramimonas_sp.AAC.1
MRMQRSELGLLPDLESRTIRICRVILRSALGFPHSTRAEGGYSAGGHRNRLKTSGASASRIQSSEP